MELDALKRTIQKFFQEDCVTIVGSGLSLSEGIPGMQGLANELRSRIPALLHDQIDKDLWTRIENDLVSGKGLEQALHDTTPSSTIEEQIRKTTAQYIGAAEAHVLLDVIQKGKVLRFSDYLNRFNIRNNGITVITTNYDRLIECACESIGIYIDTLFVGKYLGKFAPDESKYMFCNGMSKFGGKSKPTFAPKVTILKPHGCLSWHLIGTVPCSISNCQSYNPLIITPGLNKYKDGYNSPFDIHRGKANDAIDRAQRYIIIGYGFGDSHLETHLMQELRRNKPALILTKYLSPKGESIARECVNTTAICMSGTSDSKIINHHEEWIFRDVNLWDLREMIKEVF